MLPANKNQRNVLFLIAGGILLALILTFTFVINIREGIFPNKSPQTSASLSPVAEIDFANYSKIEFVFNNDMEKLNLIRGNDGSWVLVDHPERPLPQEEIQKVLMMAVGLSKVSEMNSSMVFTDRGLNPPIARLSLYTNDGSTRFIEIGKVDQDSGQYNIRIDSGNPILADFQTIYMILKIFYMKVLPVSLQDL